MCDDDMCPAEVSRSRSKRRKPRAPVVAVVRDGGKADDDDPRDEEELKIKDYTQEGQFIGHVSM